MSLYVLDAFIWILGIRGHIPQSGEFSHGRGPIVTWCASAWSR